MLISRKFIQTCVVAVIGFAVTACSAGAADGFRISPEKEKEQLAILRSDAPPGEKAIACKKLAIDGSRDAVPELAKLLSNPQLASWARIALEAIPGPEADEALRKASESLDGVLLVGTINSIGVRRDAAAVELLTARLKDKDEEVAVAAGVALGHIGNDAATKAVRDALTSSSAKVRSAAAEGSVLCAERLDQAGKSAAAVELFDVIRKADVPKQRVIEATRGAILARKQDGLPLLLELFESQDKAFFNLALSTTREFPGSDIDKALVGVMEKATNDRAALIIQAMADRPETVQIAAILKAAGTSPKPIRLSAIKALSRVGDSTSLPVLLDAAVDDDQEIAQASKATIADMPGDKVNAKLAAMLPDAKGKTYALLIELVGQRRIEATPALLKALDSSDKSLRSAALVSLGETVDIKGLPTLISQAVAPKHADDAAIAQQALKVACVRMPERDACAGELTTALGKATGETKVFLLEIIGEVGGETALKTLSASAKGKDPALQDASTRILGKWGSLDGAPVLLDLAKTAPTAQYRNRALKGYISLARRPFPMPDEARADMCQKAFDLCRDATEQKLILDVCRIQPSTETLKFAIRLMQVPALKEDASQTVLVVAQKLGAKGINVSDQLSKAGFEKVKVEIIKAEYGSGATQKDVTSIVKRQVTDLPLITLASPSYNTAFGGDPAPSTVKQLKIKYSLNGKTGEASFAEDALIVLPTPK